MNNESSNNKNFVINHLPNFNYSDLNVMETGYEKTHKEKAACVINNFGAFSFHYVSSGEGSYTICGKTYNLKPNSLFCIFPNTYIEYKQSREFPWTYYWINFTGSKTVQILDRLQLSKENPILLMNDKKLGILFKQIIPACKNSPLNSDITALSYLYRIIDRLLSHVQFSTLAENTDFSAKILNFIYENYSDPEMKLQTIADFANVTSSYLCRILKKSTGCTFVSLLTQIRLKAAIALIDNGYDSVSQIAYAVGFNDPSYFSSVFKKYNLCTPKEHILSVQKINRKKNIRLQ